jgi:hypothetical protein
MHTTEQISHSASYTTAEVTKEVSTLSKASPTPLSIVDLPFSILSHIFSFIPPKPSITVIEEVQETPSPNEKTAILFDKRVAILCSVLQPLLPGIHDENIKREFENKLANPQELFNNQALYVISKEARLHSIIGRFLDHFFHREIEGHSYHLPYKGVDIAIRLEISIDNNIISTTDLFSIIIKEIVFAMHCKNFRSQKQPQATLMIAIEDIYRIADLSSSPEVKDRALQAHVALLIYYHQMASAEVLQLINNIQCPHAQEVFRFYLEEILSPSANIQPLSKLVKAQKIRNNLPFSLMAPPLYKWIARQRERLSNHLFECLSASLKKRLTAILQDNLEKGSSSTETSCALIQDIFSEHIGVYYEDPLKNIVETLYRIANCSPSSNVKNMALQAHVALLIDLSRQSNKEIFQLIDSMPCPDMQEAFHFYLEKVVQFSSETAPHTTLIQATQFAKSFLLTSLQKKLETWIANQNNTLVDLPADTNKKDIFEYSIECSLNSKCVPPSLLKNSPHDTFDLSRVALVCRRFADVVRDQRSLCLHRALVQLSPLMRFLPEGISKKRLQTSVLNFHAFCMEDPLLTTKERAETVSACIQSSQLPSKVESLQEGEQKELYRACLKNFKTECLDPDKKIGEKAIEAFKALSTLLPLVEDLSPGEHKYNLQTLLTLYKENCQKSSVLLLARYITEFVDSTLLAVDFTTDIHYMRSIVNGHFPYSINHWMLLKLFRENALSDIPLALIDQYDAYLATQPHYMFTSLRIAEWYLQAGRRDKTLDKLRYATERSQESTESMVKCMTLYKASHLYQQLGDLSQALSVANSIPTTLSMLTWNMSNPPHTQIAPTRISIPPFTLQQRRLRQIHAVMHSTAVTA